MPAIVRRRARTVLIILVAMVQACRAAARVPVRAASGGGDSEATAACLPVEQLPPDEQRFVRDALLRMSDGEGLYTAAGGIKPISSDVVQIRVPVSPHVDRARMDSLAQLQRLAELLTCGDIGIGTQLYTVLHPGRDSSERVLTASWFVHHGPALRAAITRHAELFGSLRITSATAPVLAVTRVDAADRAPRWRAYGHLFGYPGHAVDFFVRAGLRGDSTGRIEPRDFRRIDTWRRLPERDGGPEVHSTFVYAVPKGSSETAEDSTLRARAASVFAEYQARRARWITPEYNGIVELWREWIGVGALRSSGRQ